MDEKELRRVKDEYDLIALIGKSMGGSNAPPEVKDAIKDIAREIYRIGYTHGQKSKAASVNNGAE